MACSNKYALEAVCANSNSAGRGRSGWIGAVYASVSALSAVRREAMGVLSSSASVLGHELMMSLTH